jgi:hypothetical protein
MALLLTIPSKVAVSKIFQNFYRREVRSVSSEQFPATDCNLFGGIAFVQVNIITKA